MRRSACESSHDDDTWPGGLFGLLIDWRCPVVILEPSHGIKLAFLFSFCSPLSTRQILLVIRILSSHTHTQCCLCATVSSIIIFPSGIKKTLRLSQLHFRRLPLNFLEGKRLFIQYMVFYVAPASLLLNTVQVLLSPGGLIS